MRKSSRSSRMQCPESAPALSVPIVMVINLLAPSLQSGARWHLESRGVINTAPADKLHSAGRRQENRQRQHFYELLSFCLPTVRVPHLRSLDVFPESFKKLQGVGGVLLFFFSLPVQKENRFFCECMGECAEAAKKLSTFRAWLILAGFAFPHGCDPGSKSNARIDLRQQNAGLQQSGALHYSNFSQGRKKRTCALCLDKLACGESLE